MEDYRNIIKEEIKRCILDPTYFCKKYCYIINQDEGKILFDLYEFQEDVLIEFQINNELLILKSRQLGISTLAAAFSLWFILFNPAKYVLFVSKRQKDATGLIDKVKIMHKYLPSWLKNFAKPVSNNQMSIAFNNNSKISAESTTEDTGRSTSNALVILDEFAFAPKAESLFGSLYQTTVSSGGKMIVISTPNGIGNKFHKLWVEAESGLNGFKPIKLRWDVHPKHDQKWRDDQTKKLGVRMAAQECDANFTTSGNNIISPVLLKQLSETTIYDPILKKGPKKALWIWNSPLPGHEYIVCADVARGNGKDYSACHVLDKESCEQVAEFKEQISTREFGQFLVDLAQEYNDALLVCENASIGWDVIQTIIELEYPNLYYTNRGMFGDPNAFLRRNLDISDVGIVPGFTTSGKTRPLIVGKLELYFEEGALIIHSQRLIDELHVFIWHGDKAEAMSGYNDDLVLSLAIGLFVRDSYNKLNRQGLELTKAAIENISASMIKSTKEYEKSEVTKQWEMALPNGEVESLEWLIR